MYFVSIRHIRPVFSPTIWGDHIKATTAGEARAIAAKLYQQAKTERFDDDRLNALLAAQPPLSDCEIIARKSRTRA